MTRMMTLYFNVHCSIPNLFDYGNTPSTWQSAPSSHSFITRTWWATLSINLLFLCSTSYHKLCLWFYANVFHVNIFLRFEYNTFPCVRATCLRLYAIINSDFYSVATIRNSVVTGKFQTEGNFNFKLFYSTALMLWNWQYIATSKSFHSHLNAHNAKFIFKLRQRLMWFSTSLNVNVNKTMCIWWLFRVVSDWCYKRVARYSDWCNPRIFFQSLWAFTISRIDELLYENKHRFHRENF